MSGQLPPPTPVIVQFEPRRTGCLMAVAVILFIGLAFSMFLNLVLAARHAPGPGPQKPLPMTQRWVAGESDAKVCLIELSGVIMDEVRADGLFGLASRPVERIERELDEAANDAKVKAVLFSVDSPGGSV